MSVRSVVSVIVSLVLMAGFMIMKPAISYAQEYLPFSQESERARRQNVEGFRQNQQHKDQSANEIVSDQLKAPLARFRDLQPFSAARINDSARDEEFSDELLTGNQDREERFEAKGGEDRLRADTAEERLRRRRDRQEARYEAKGEREDQSRRGRNQRNGTQIDSNDLDQLEGRDQATQGNQFEDQFLAAERELGGDEPGNQVAGNQRQGNNRAANNSRRQTAVRRNGRANDADAQSIAQAQADQEGDPNDITGSIRTNAPEDIYAAEGKRFGSFLLFPEITITGHYSDNPTASPANRPGDYALEILPRFILRSDWARHQLEFEGQLTKSYYEELTSENVDEWFLSSSGRIDIQNNHYLQLDARIASIQDSRGDADNLNTDAQLADLQTMSVTALYNYEWNRTTLQLSSRLTDFDYEDAVDSLGVVTNNDDQDYLETNAAVRLAYTFHPGLYLFGEGRTSIRDYDASIDDQGTQRGSTAYTAEIGAIYDISSLLRMELIIGHHWQQADEASFVDIKEMVYSASLTYRPSRLTTMTLRTQREVEGTDLGGTIGVIETTYSAMLSHYFRPHILMTSSLTYEEEDYAGVLTQQDTLTAGITLQYIFNRHARILASYEFSSVEINDGNDYEENVFRVGLNLRP